MNGLINLASSNSDIEVRYGIYDLGGETEEARSSLRYIMSDINDIKKSYFRLGFHLHEFKTHEYYKDFGFLTFEEFCEANIDLDKGAISRCINVFLMTNAGGEVSYKSGVKIVGCGSYMSDKYKDYSYSQLVEMLPLDEERRKHCSSDMTVKQIRELKGAILDIKDEDICKFFELVNIKPFTREKILEKFTAWGKCYTGYVDPDGFDYYFFPGKVSICGSREYPFGKILDFYISCGGHFEDEKVAMSQPEEMRLCMNDLLYKKGIVLQNHVKKSNPLCAGKLEIYNSSGKLVAVHEGSFLLEEEVSAIGKLIIFRTDETGEGKKVKEND